MTWVTPHTYFPGDGLTADLMNQISDELNDLHDNAVQIATNEDEIHFNNTDFATIAGGPTLTGLLDGNYVVWFGAALNSVALDSTYMAVRVNNVTDSDKLEAQVAAHISVSRVVLVTLDAGDGLNRIDAVYSCELGHDNDQRRGWMVAVKFSDL